MYNEAITLISKTNSVDAYGDKIEVRQENTVFAAIRSIGQSEFYQAQAVGLKPDIKFVIADFLDYQNESSLKYCPFGGIEEEYSIIRTYRKDNELEITCKRGVD